MEAAAHAASLIPFLCRGQARFRNMWERYCRGVSAIVFVVDSSIPLPSSSTSSSGPSTGAGSAPSEGNDSAAWGVAAEELHALVSRPMLAGVPLLVLATKNDVQGAASAEEVIRVM